jgi:hypothetical protein
MNDTHGIPVLHAQIVILEVDIQVGQDELRPSPKPETIQSYIQDQLIIFPNASTIKPKESATRRVRRGEGETARRTSSLIFFQMILVISSPSNSTTGFLTLILVATAC